MSKRGLWQGDVGRAIRVVAVLALAYALALRGPAALAASMPGADPLLGAAHVLCLNDEGAPDPGAPLGSAKNHCGECCLSHARSNPAVATVPAIPVVWPERTWQVAEQPTLSRPHGPPGEAWSRARAQRGPPMTIEPTELA